MMTFHDIKKHNAEQVAKYPGATLLFIPTFLADLAIGHGLSIDGYLVTTWQYEPGPEMVYDVEVGDIRRAPMRSLSKDEKIKPSSDLSNPWRRSIEVKALQDAGFPQNTDGTHPKNEIIVHSGQPGFEPGRYYVPTLEELIEACIDDKFLLIHDEDGWYAENKPGMSPSDCETPLEAVARLWLDIN
jgi:hypothetical protein